VVVDDEYPCRLGFRDRDMDTSRDRFRGHLARIDRRSGFLSREGPTEISPLK
jgi:hypothetical protein